jgi:hypothetical protein
MSISKRAFGVEGFQSSHPTKKVKKTLKKEEFPLFKQK